MPNHRKYAEGFKVGKRKTPVGRAQELFNNARTRAKKRGLPCTITRDWVIGALSGRCAATGLEFDFASRSPFAPSLDQIDPALGYTPENTRLVIAIFNYAKNIWTDADVTTLARALIAANAR